MDIQALQRNWDQLARTDPFWAILTRPGKDQRRWNADDFFATGDEEIRAVMGYIQSLGLPMGNGKALDFGCGVGRLTQALAPYFAEVYGVDIAPAMIELANEYNRHRSICSYYLNESADLHLFPDDTFDLIYTNVVLQHIEPRYSIEYIKEFLRVLKVDGLLIFQLPSERAKTIRGVMSHIVPLKILNVYRTLKYGREGMMEMHGIKKAFIEKLVIDHGGDIIDVTKDPNMETFWINYRYCVKKSAQRSDSH